MSNERSKYDLQQAHAMRGKTYTSSSRKTKNRPLSNSNDTAAQPSLDGATEALQGLDRAEDLATNGKLEEASSLYQHSIESLIRILNEMKSANSGAHSLINREVLLERTRVALTDAEAVKEKIKKLKEAKKDQYLQIQKKQQQKKTPETNNYGREGLGRFFTSIRSKSERLVTKQNQERDGDIHEPPELRPSKSSDGRLTTKTKPAAAARSTSVTNNAKRSNLNYKTNDPFIETIKKDIYVDSKSLTTTWNDISGLAEPKQALQEAAILPLVRPDLYTGLRAAPKGILLYGPPGTGKTMLVKAVAHESQCILFACSASAMTSKWVGEGEKLVRTLFRMAADVAPSIIFLDEIDSMLGRRKSDGNTEQESSRRFKTEFMVQMDGIAAGSGSSDSSQNKTLLIGCTNCPWDIDEAVMRRFQRRIYVPLPDRDARRTLWKNLLRKSKGSVKVSSRELDQLVKSTQGFSCSDISSLANEAAFGPLRDLGGIEAIKDVSINDVRPIQMKDFEHAIKNAKKSVSDTLLKRYKEWETAQAALGG